MTPDLRLVLTIRAPGGGLIDRSDPIGDGEAYAAWAARWADVVDERGVTVELDTADGWRLGILGDEGLELTPLGMTPLLQELTGVLFP